MSHEDAVAAPCVAGHVDELSSEKAYLAPTLPLQAIWVHVMTIAQCAMRINDMPNKLLTPAEVSEALGIPVQTLAQWRWRNIGPAYHSVGRHVRYQLADIDAWLEANRHQGGDAA